MIATVPVVDPLEARRVEVRAALATLAAERARLRARLAAGDLSAVRPLAAGLHEAQPLELELAELDQAVAERTRRAARAAGLRQAAATVADTRRRLAEGFAPQPALTAQYDAWRAERDRLQGRPLGLDDGRGVGGRPLGSVRATHELEALAFARRRAEALGAQADRLAAQAEARASRRADALAVDADLEGVAVGLEAAAEAALAGAPPDVAGAVDGVMRARDGLVRLASVPEEASARPWWQGLVDQLETAWQALRG